MKNINISNFNDESGINTLDLFPANSSIRAPLKIKLSMMQFSPKANFNLLSTENTTAYNNTNSPFRAAKRINSLQLNPLNNKNDLHLRDSFCNINFNSETNFNSPSNFNYTLNNNNNYNIYNYNDQKVIKSKFNNQSELSVSLNFLRGKSLKHLDLRNSFNETSNNNNKNSKFNKTTNNNHNFNSKNKINKNNKNFSSTSANLNNFTQNPFARFFKKPLSFRIDEFEEINLLEKDEINKQNKAYAQQRFFGNTVSESNPSFNCKGKITVNDLNSHSNDNSDSFADKINKNKISKNANLDDIEKVTLVNNQEELVKKYVLPEMKYLTTEERKKLVNYYVHDKSERFVINKGNTIFLADLFKGELNKNKKGNLNAENSVGFKASRSPEKVYDPRKTEIDVSETKYGMYPKFLMRTSSFVRCIDSSCKNEIEAEDHKGNNRFSQTLVPKKLSFQNAFGVNSNFNMNFNNDIKNDFNANCNQNSEEMNHFEGNNVPQMRISANIYAESAYNNKYDYKDFNVNDPKTTKNSKNSLTGFNYNISNSPSNNNNNHFKITQNNPADIQNASRTNLANVNNHTTDNFNKNITATSYISNQGYEINQNRNLQSQSKKNNRIVILDYPQIKFPVQPYKRLTEHKTKKDLNYITNGSMIDDPETIKKVKEFNEQVASNFKNEKEIYITNEMSQNIDKLNVIEKKINTLIQNSKEGMKENKEYRKFNSDKSIVIIK